MKRVIYQVLICLFLIIAGTVIGINCSVATLESPQSSTQSIEVYFSPDGGIRDRIIKAIDLSKTTIDIAIYSFTSKDVAQALRKAKERGVSIRLIMDSGRAKRKHSQYKFLDKNGFNVKLKRGKGRGIMHHKVCIFDNRLVMTGSYNISKNAERFSYENVVFIPDKSVVKKYQEMFEDLWGK